MSKRLYDMLLPCKKEEEVKDEFVKFFKIKLNALRQIDHYSEEILYEFKLDNIACSCSLLTFLPDCLSQYNLSHSTSCIYRSRFWSVVETLA